MNSTHKMVWKKDNIPPQFLLNEEISVTIIEVKDPAHFIIKESPSVKLPRTLEFVEFEDAMQKYYRSVEQAFFQLPLKDTVVVARFENKYYRARVCSILNMTRGYIIKVYLVDYGKECSITRPCLYEIPEDFLKLPFQAVDFRFDLEPISLVMDPCKITVDYGPVSEWDVSAFTFIEDIRKAMKNIFVKAENVGQGYVTGVMRVSLQNGETKCINDELVQKKFARERPSDKMALHPVADISFHKEKNVPDSSSLVSALTSQPKQTGNISSTQKLRALLKKRYQAQNKIVASSTDNKETVILTNNIGDLSLKSDNYEKNEYERNFIKQEESHSDIKYKHSIDAKDLNKVSTVDKSNCDFVSSTDPEAISKVKDITKDITVETVKKENQCTEFPVKITGAFHLKRLMQIRAANLEKLSRQEGKVKSMDVPQISNDSLSSVQIKHEQANSSCAELNRPKLQEQSESLPVPRDLCATSIKSNASKNILSNATHINQSVESMTMSTSTTHQPKKSNESSGKISPYEKFRRLYRQNRLNYYARCKGNTSSEDIQTPEEFNSTNNIAKSKTVVESSHFENTDNKTEKTSCMESEVETMIFEEEKNVTEETPFNIDNPQQVIPDSDFFDMDDSSSEGEINRN